MTTNSQVIQHEAFNQNKQFEIAKIMVL